MKAFTPLFVPTAVLLVAAACGGSATAMPTPVPTPTPTETPQPTATPTQAPERAITVVLPVPVEPLIIPVGLTDASPPPDAPGRTGGSFGFSQYVFEEVGGEVVTTLVEGPRGEQVRAPISYLELKQLYDQGEPPPEELRMSLEELEELVRQLDTARDAIEKYRDVEVALAEGYAQVGGDVPNMGAHFVNQERVEDGVFDPSRPEILLYSRDVTRNWQLVGTAFILPTQDFGHEHPEAFAGPLDNWHVHYSLCRGSSGGFTSTTREECDVQRGDWISSFGWMIHAYVIVDNPLGVFHMWNPKVPPVVSAGDIRQSRSAAIPQDAVSLAIEYFSHREARLMVGQTVAWTNVDEVPHTVTLGSSGMAVEGFDSGNIAPGQSFGVRFDQPGEYHYTCSLHPFMNGTVTVIQPIQLDPRIYDAYVGQYEIVFLDLIFKITKENDHLFGQIPGESKVELYPESEIRYFVPKIGAQLTFIKDERGEATHLILHVYGQDIRATRIK